MNDMQIKSFFGLVGKLEKGKTLHDVESAMKEVLAQVKATGKAGSVTLKIDFAMADADSNMVKIVPDVSSKVPKTPRKHLNAFTNEQGELSDRDPDLNQRPVRDASADVGNVANLRGSMN